MFSREFRATVVRTLLLCALVATEVLGTSVSAESIAFTNVRIMDARPGMEQHRIMVFHQKMVELQIAIRCGPRALRKE